MSNHHDSIVASRGDSDVQSVVVERTGYKGFGSFHSDNLEELLSRAAEETEQSGHRYEAPPIPFEWSDLKPNEIPQQFGHSCRELFLLDPKWTFINHGAFGCTARYPFDFAQKWYLSNRRSCSHTRYSSRLRLIDPSLRPTLNDSLEQNDRRIHIERQPLRGLDRELFPQIVNSMRQLGQFLEADPRDFVLLNNATTGLSTIIRSVGETLTSQDAIYALDIGYGAVKKLLKSVSESTGALFKESSVNLSHRRNDEPPLDEEELLALVERELPANTKLVVFDHVASNSSLVLPIEKLATLCRRLLGDKVVIVIDGAHGPLNLSLRFGGIRRDDSNSRPSFDFYVGNLHKWFSNNKGSAFLWSRRGSRTTRTRDNNDSKGEPLFIHSLNVSHGFSEGSYRSVLIGDKCY